MILLRDLTNRVYRGKTCMRFEYNIKSDEDNYIVANFTRKGNNLAEWNMQIILKRTSRKDSDVYNFGYIMPRENLPLELIAATGLRYFQLYLKDEIQQKSNLDFALGEIVRGM